MLGTIAEEGVDRGMYVEDASGIELRLLARRRHDIRLL